MNIIRLAQSRRLFNSEFVHPHTNRENRLRWVRSLRVLGDRWLLAPQAKEWK